MPYINTKQAAHILGRSISHTNKLARHYGLPYLSKKGGYLYDLDAVLRYGIKEGYIVRETFDFEALIEYGIAQGFIEVGYPPKSRGSHIWNAALGILLGLILGGLLAFALGWLPLRPTHNDPVLSQAVATPENSL